MKKMNNKYIVKLLDVLHSANNTYIITEYCPGGDLREFLKKNKYDRISLISIGIYQKKMLFPFSNNYS